MFRNACYAVQLFAAVGFDKMSGKVKNAVILICIQRGEVLQLVAQHYAGRISLPKIADDLFCQLRSAEAFSSIDDTVKTAHTYKRIDIFKSGDIAVIAQLSLRIQYPGKHYQVVAEPFSLRVYTAEQLITDRAAVGEEVKTALDSKLNNYGIYIEKFNIVNFDFSEEFNNAIEAKQVAEQNLLKTQTEQEQAIVVAEANAKQKVIAADADADAILARAQAQADANKLLEESLSDKVIAYEQIEKWDGVLPKVSGSGSGFLIDVGADGVSSGSSNAAVSTGD